MKDSIFASRRDEAGFTLVELLVSIAILSIILLGMAAAISFVSKAWLSGSNAVDNFTKARSTLNNLDRDIQMMVMRRNVAAFVDSAANPACAFYTNVEGFPGTDTRAISLVQYVLNTTTGSASNPPYTLDRNEFGMNFVPSAGTGIPIAVVASGATPELTQLTPTNLQTEALSSGVIAFAWQFIDGSGKILTPPYKLSSTPPVTSPNIPNNATTPFWFDYSNQGGTYNPRIVVVSMVVLSNRAYEIASVTSTLTNVVNCFSTATPVNQTYSQVWDGFLAAPNAAFLSLPQPLRDSGSIEVFERHIPLPITTPTS